MWKPFMYVKSPDLSGGVPIFNHKPDPPEQVSVSM